MEPRDEIKSLKLELLNARAAAAVLRNFVKEKRHDACVCLKSDVAEGKKCVNCTYFDKILEPGAGKELLDRHVALMREVERLREELRRRDELLKSPGASAG